MNGGNPSEGRLGRQDLDTDARAIGAGGDFSNEPPGSAGAHDVENRPAIRLRDAAPELLQEDVVWVQPHFQRSSRIGSDDPAFDCDPDECLGSDPTRTIREFAGPRLQDTPQSDGIRTRDEASVRVTDGG